MIDKDAIIRNFPNTYHLIQHYVEDFNFKSFNKMPFSCQLSLAEAYYKDCPEESIFDIFEVTTPNEVNCVFVEITKILRLDVPLFRQFLINFIHTYLKDMFDHIFDYLDSFYIEKMTKPEYDPIESDRRHLAQKLNAQLI